MTHDITHLTRASVFSEVGKQTPIAARFSTVWGERGSADTNRLVESTPIANFTKLQVDLDEKLPSIDRPIRILVIF